MTDAAGFESFWAAYPRKSGKGAARKAWTKIHPSLDTQGLILSAVEQQKHCDQWSREGGQYIPMPSTWLNQERWSDEVTTPVSGTPPRDREAGGAWHAIAIQSSDFRDKRALCTLVVPEWDGEALAVYALTLNAGLALVRQWDDLVKVAAERGVIIKMLGD